MGQNASWSHEIVLSADAASASKARDFVCVHLTEHHLQYLVEDVRLVVSELATNAMVHARTSFTVTLLQEGDRSVLLTVQDGSPLVPVGLDVDVLDTIGRGLSIVDCLSDDSGVIPGLDGTKSMWATFATHARESA